MGYEKDVMWPSTTPGFAALISPQERTSETLQWLVDCTGLQGVSIRYKHPQPGYIQPPTLRTMHVTLLYIIYDGSYMEVF